jgi:hypothetical protein
MERIGMDHWDATSLENLEIAERVKGLLTPGSVRPDDLDTDDYDPNIASIEDYRRGKKPL